MSSEMRVSRALGVCCVCSQCQSDLAAVEAKPVVLQVV